MARDLDGRRHAAGRPDRARPIGWAADHRGAIGLTLAGLVLRLGFVIRHRGPLAGDPLYYHWQAQLVAKGHGFLQPVDWKVLHLQRPGADHPPLQTLWLALWSVVGLGSTRWHLVAGAVAGAATIALVFATADLVAGRRAAVAAGVMAAVWPNLVFWSVGGYAESIAATCVALFTFLAVRYLRAPSMGRLVEVAAAATLAGLARSELILLVVAVVPLLLVAEPLSWRSRLRWLAAAGAVVVVLVGPWAAYNQARFERPVPLSTGLGLVLVSSNCDAEYYGSSIGYWWFNCSASGSVAARQGAAADTSVVDGRMRTVAVRYIGQHRSRFPAVAVARVGRMFGVFRPSNSVALAGTSEGIDHWVMGSITTTWWLALGLGVAGAVSLRRRSVHLTPFLAPVIVIAFSAVVSYGIVRFRAPAEPAVLVLAGVAVDRAFALVGRRAVRPPG